AFAFPKSARLLRRADYVAIKQRGKSFAEGPLAASFRPRDPTSTGIAVAGARVGLTVSSKIGSAVTRNRIKRRLREAVRLELASLLQSTWCWSRGPRRPARRSSSSASGYAAPRPV